jgi:Mg-chelatase subunit ChlD
MPVFRRLFWFPLWLCFFAAGALAQSAPVDIKAEPAANGVLVGIVVDCSGSQRLQLDRTIGMVKQIVNSLHENDRASIVRFVDSQKISVVQEFTSDKSELRDTADELYIEGGLTAIVDAVYFAAKYFSDEPAGSGTMRTMILISDGDDRNSAKRTDETVALLKSEQIRVFAIAISDLKVSTKLLDKLTKETGGKTFVPRTTAEVSNAVLEAVKSMRIVETSGK